MKSKIYDCVTFFDNNFIFNLRYNILKDFVDCFIVCESKFDHKGKPKKINWSELIPEIEIAAVKENTAKILIDEADYYHGITSDDWFVYKALKKTTYNKK